MWQKHKNARKSTSQKWFVFLLGLGFATLLVAQKPELSVPGHNLFVNNIAAAKQGFPGATGRGMVVSVKERLFQVEDIDFKGRVQLPNSSYLVDPTAHATIMATLIGGAGTSGSQGAGVASECILVPSGFNGAFQADPDTFYRHWQITVQNHAYGLDVQNEYSASAKSYDLSSLSNTALVHVFSAGNSAGSTSSSGLYAGVPGFANLTGSFKMAKNALVVGALDSFGQIQPFSSRGPAYDGRIKPDLCAYGHDGTSESAALVSGAAALLQQVYNQRFNLLPESHLVRAALMGSARDIGLSGPDYLSGWGRMDLEQALQVLAKARFINASVPKGTAMPLPLELPDQLRRAKITLVWNDDAPQGQDVRTKALFSDLNVSVRGPDGTLHHPWHPNPYPHPDSLVLNAARGLDTLNNVEQVSLDWPGPGLYTVFVDASAAKSANTDFSLVWTFDTIGHFSWDYPRRQDPVLAGRDVVLQWDTNLPDSMVVIEWKWSDWTDWTPVSAFVRPEDGALRWRVPASYGTAQVRCCTNKHCYVSDTFLIAGTLKAEIGFNCPDSVYISWNTLAPNMVYQVLGLGAQQLEPLFLTKDTFVVLPKALFPQSHFAVQAIDPLISIQSLRSPAPNISRQGVACYVSQFYAESTPENKPALTLALGTNYGLENVRFERMEGGQFTVLWEIDRPQETWFQYTDGQVLPGLHQYRAVFNTTAGGVIYSKVLTVFVPGNAGWWVYPNPVGSGGDLQVISDAPDDMEFRLFDLLGRELKRQIIADVRDYVSMAGVASGVYAWGIYQNDQRIGVGKLVVE